MSPELLTLREQAWFKKLLMSLMEEAPSIRPHNPDDPLCVEKWKADSAKREGFFIALSKFGYTLDDLKGDK